MDPSLCIIAFTDFANSLNSLTEPIKMEKTQMASLYYILINSERVCLVTQTLNFYFGAERVSESCAFHIPW